MDFVVLGFSSQLKHHYHPTLSSPAKAVVLVCLFTIAPVVTPHILAIQEACTKVASGPSIFLLYFFLSSSLVSLPVFARIGFCELLLCTHFYCRELFFAQYSHEASLKAFWETKPPIWALPLSTKRFFIFHFAFLIFLQGYLIDIFLDKYLSTLEQLIIKCKKLTVMGRFACFICWQ